MIIKHGTPRGFSRKRLLGTALCALVLGAPQLPASVGFFVPVAHAQSTNGQGGGGQHGTGGTHGSATSGSGAGQHGPSAESEAKGPRAGGTESNRKPEAETQGGRPAWAKEGIPEVELGRLSVARSPASVLDHAFEEVTTNWSTTGTTIITLTTAVDLSTGTVPAGTEITVAQLYSMTAADFSAIVATNYDAVTRIDSPLENLSLLKNLLSTDTTALTGVTPASVEDLAGIFLGSASDKTIEISTDTVTAINTILGLPDLSATETAAIAADAEEVRDAILTGHGE